MYSFKAKLWIEKDNEFIMSGGRALFLKLINEKNSLNAVAKEMKMSYRHLWGIVKKINKNAKEELIKTEGKKTFLTEKGKELLKEFEMVSRELENFLKYGKKPIIAVDGIILINGKVVLVKRKNPPFQNCFALPGGFVEYGEETENAVLREVKEETNLNCKVKRLVGVYSNKERDPRWHVISVVYELTFLSGKLKSGDDAKEVKLFDLNERLLDKSDSPNGLFKSIHSSTKVDEKCFEKSIEPMRQPSKDGFQSEELPKIAFDHAKILNDYITQSAFSPKK